MARDINFNRWVDLEGLPYGKDLQARLVYDSNTKVIYMLIDKGFYTGTSLSPYYIVNDEGKAEIAILGKNYFAG